ncbi:MAG: baseplate wedge protein 53, partial [bacterium]
QYGDPQLHWVILMINKINDPLFELPLSRDALERKIVKQYGYSSISEAYSSIHHYELEVTRKLIEVDGATTETTNTSIVTLNQYNYTSNTIQVKGLGSQNSEIIGPVNFYANNSDNTSAVVATLTMTSTYKPV